MKKFLALFFSIALSAALNAHAAPVANNTPGFIKQATDLGPLDPNSVINVTVVVAASQRREVGHAR